MGGEKGGNKREWNDRIFCFLLVSVKQVLEKCCDDWAKQFFCCSRKQFLIFDLFGRVEKWHARLVGSGIYVTENLSRFVSNNSPDTTKNFYDCKFSTVHQTSNLDQICIFYVRDARWRIEDKEIWWRMKNCRRKNMVSRWIFVTIFFCTCFFP